MISIFLNDQPMHLAPLASIDELLDALEDKPRGFAIAVNERFVPRSAYRDVRLNSGDRVELLVPSQGG